MKILYVDLFNPPYSNHYWRKAFERAGEVQYYCITWGKEGLIKRVKAFQPDHIHCGGGVKTLNSSGIGRQEVELFKKVARRVTFWYGDVYANPYHSEFIDLIDRLYVSNMTRLGPNVEFMLHPSDPEVFRPTMDPKIPVAVFVGNNYSQERVQQLKRLSQKIPLHVYGKRWRKRGVNNKGKISYNDYSKVIGKYAIAVDDIQGRMCGFTGMAGCTKGHVEGYQTPICCNTDCTDFELLKGYYSNRPTNNMLCGLFTMLPYKDGIEDVFENRKEVVWYHSFDELVELAKYYLEHEEEREEIARNGLLKALREHTFDSAVRRILDGPDY